MKRITSSVLVTLSLVMGLFVFGAPNASAAEVEWYSAYPSANNSTYMKWYEESERGPYSTSYPKVYNDSAYLTIYGYDETTYYEVITWDFNNEDYSYCGTAYEVNVMPPDGAELTSVKIVADFYGGHPDCFFGYSLNGGTDWTYSSVYHYYQSLVWTVTDLYAWDDDNLNSTSTQVGLWAHPPYGANYQLDYLGWYIGWMAEEDGPWAPPDFPTEDDSGFDFSINADSIPIILGLVGMVGVVAIPAIGIYVYRHGNEDAVTVFVKILAAFMVFATFFMLAFVAD